jgi:signal transduction histidine kinase
MVLPLVGTQRVRGALIVARLEGRARFTAAELEMATTFANQAAVAVELADARADQQRMTLLEDRDRIGRDLHDHVIQRLFGVGLTVESIASGLSADPRGNRLAQAVTDIDATIRQIRTTIFQLRGPLGPYTGGVRAQILEVAAELAVALGFQPSVTFAGPVDSVVPDAVIDDLSAVVREALSNTARHAQAKHVTVSLSVGEGELCLEVTDDGVGIGDTDRRSGLANLRKRAALHHGTLVVTSPFPDCGGVDPQGGTSVRWTIPLD